MTTVMIAVITEQWQLIMTKIIYKDFRLLYSGLLCMLFAERNPNGTKRKIDCSRSLFDSLGFIIYSGIFSNALHTCAFFLLLLFMRRLRFFFLISNSREGERSLKEDIRFSD